jgi:hypothetical protein
MIKIDTTGLQMRIREGLKGDEIFDPFRKKWVSLTPEEWVRQSLLAFLVQKEGYPSALIAVERGVRVGELNRRFDAVVFDKAGKPGMLIECKSPDEPLDDSVISQLLSYQSVLQAPFLMITNGRMLRCWKIEGLHLSELEEIPPVKG